VDSVAMPARVGPQRLRPGIIACRQLPLLGAAGRRVRVLRIRRPRRQLRIRPHVHLHHPDGVLEQYWGRWHPYPFVAVASFHQWDCSVGPADAADDRAEDIGEFETNQQQPLGVGLRPRALQQRHQSAGAGQAVLNEAVMGEFKQFLDADSGVPQHLDDRPKSKNACSRPDSAVPARRCRTCEPRLWPTSAWGRSIRVKVLPATVNDCPSGFCSLAANSS
jgi:hypothetical protein